MLRQLRIPVALIAALAVASPAGGFAQTMDVAPPPAPAPPAGTAGATPALPSYALPTPAPAPVAPPSYQQPGPPPSYGQSEVVLRGQIVAFDGKYAMQIRDEKGYIDNIQLRQGTIINPTGLQLVSGMAVTIRGTNAGSYVSAIQIDTPYQSYGFAVPGYPVYAYPYPAYVAPAYPWGAAAAGFAIGVGVGAFCCNAGWGYRGGWGYGGGWHGGWH